MNFKNLFKPSFIRIISSLLVFVLIFYIKYIIQIRTEISQTVKNTIIADSFYWAIILTVFYYILYSIAKNYFRK